MGGTRKRSRKHQTALGLGNRPSRFFGGFDPFLNDDFHIG